LGPFIMQENGRPGFLSAAHVLAPGDARAGDFIHQPGALHRLPTGETRIATFVGAVQDESKAEDLPILPGIACAELLDGIDAEGNRLPDGAPGAGQFLAEPARDSPSLGDEVAMIGRTSGVRIGRITIVEIDNLRVQMPKGAYRLPEAFAISGEGGAFSQPGDAGAVIYRIRDLSAVGVVFAGDPEGSPEASSYGLPLAPALAGLRARLLTGSLTSATRETTAV
jgi:hypothetical protein